MFCGGLPYYGDSKISSAVWSTNKEWAGIFWVCEITTKALVCGLKVVEWAGYFEGGVESKPGRTKVGEANG